MRRRQFLVNGTALLSVAVAGCGHPSTVLDMDEATAADIAVETSTGVDPGSEEYDLVSSAADNESAIRTGRYELFDHTDTIRAGEKFYEVSETRLGSSEVTVYEVLVDFDPDDSTPERAAIAFDDLPEADRERLAAIVSDDDHPEQDGFDVGVSYGTSEEIGNESVFVPERRYDVLIHDEDRYRVAVDSWTAPEAEYRYEVTEVASSFEAFADQIRAQYLFTLRDLSDAEREVVEEAIDGTYFENDEAFRSVRGRLQEQDGLDEQGTYGTWLVEYDGVEYLTYAEW